MQQAPIGEATVVMIACDGPLHFVLTDDANVSVEGPSVLLKPHKRFWIEDVPASARQSVSAGRDVYMSAGSQDFVGSSMMASSTLRTVSIPRTVKTVVIGFGQSYTVDEAARGAFEIVDHP